MHRFLLLCAFSALFCKTLLAKPQLLESENLMAWCIVPFDAKQRGPEARAQMLQELGFKKFAYDWRAEHIPTFSAEVTAMKSAGIEITAWWFPATLDAEAKQILEVLARQKISPQLWVTGGGEMLQPGKANDARLEAEAQRIKPIAEAAAKLGCKVGLYNHGGWFGEPENQLDLVQRLQTQGIQNVGLVYNFHHGHEHLPRFGELIRKMKPHLLSVNLNGMVRSGSKILPLGKGDQELEMLRVLLASGWKGPVGILDHRPETDSAETLRENLAGLKKLIPQLEQPDQFTAQDNPAPVAFYPDAVPLEMKSQPYAQAFVNRDRTYDFYAKQAQRFANSNPLPQLVPAFAGLDSGRHGHWGNQNEELWQDLSWNALDAGGVQAGIVKVNQKILPRAVCLQLGNQRELAACFDTETLTWEAVWTGPFVKYEAMRWGMLGAVQPAGTLQTKPASEPAIKGSFTYHGFYRHGGAVIFSFTKDGSAWLERASVENGVFTRKREKADGELAKLTKGGPANWPQTFTSKGSLGQQQPYAMDTISFPETPWKSIWHVCGHDFFPNGDAVLCTFEGEVWLVSGLTESLQEVRWKRFAGGLNQPLGLKVVDGKVFLLCRDQLMRLHDLNGDQEADFYECYSRAFQTPVGGHDYLTGLETDAQGRFYFASGKLGLTRISADGKTTERLATGFRNPNGLAVSPEGRVVAAAQEGDWTAASLLAEIVPGGHYRHGGPKPGALGDLPPTLYFPRGVDNSCGGQLFLEQDTLGFQKGNLLHLSWGYGTAFVILQESLDGQSQGCAVKLPVEFSSGAHRARTHPQDGHVYFTGSTGWGTYTPDAGCFQRVRLTAKSINKPIAFHSHENGVRVEFSQPLSDVSKPAVFAQQWNYRIGPAYGSEEYSIRWPEQAGHDVLAIQSVQFSADRKSVFLEIPQLLPCHQLHLHLPLPELLTQDFFFTLHRLGPAYTNFPGYSAIAKKLPGAPVAAPGLDVLPSPYEKGTPGRALKIQTAAGLQFAQTQLTAKAGEQLSLTLENGDLIPHNWVLGKVGTRDKIADQADRNLADPKALPLSYVPQIPEVIASTRIANPGTSTTIHFKVPEEKGDYPYLCTFPGHTKIMIGVLKVE
jgi:azurin/sugar phosphate isomerase/epimerase